MVLKVDQEVAVVVTDRLTLIAPKFLVRGLLFCLMTLSSALQAAVLPEERADVMYHRYEGGGVAIDGPSVIVRKNFVDAVSLNGKFYVDKISSASIDVVTSGASRYSEERTEYGGGIDYLHDTTTMSANFTLSTENDYDAQTWSVGLSQDFFGGLSTIGLAYANGNDEIRQTGNPDFKADASRHNFVFSLTQVLTDSAIMSVIYEAITDEGFLNNPYRFYRYLNNPDIPADGYSIAQEVYPNTRTSDAIAVNVKYYLPYRAAVGAGYRYFTDDWDISANTFFLTYTQPIGEHWILDFTWRYYQQGHAFFYNDLFQFASQDAKDYRARDKELSAFNTTTYGVAVSYDIPLPENRFVGATILSLQWDYLQFDYQDFRDIRDSTVAGDEPLYNFSANVVKLFFTVAY
ncbi:Uncharacterised protein [BD1-7 clade bacterium]|uniref:DUF3570 domain-containing protein n=1 Tax=BD1-7 clade bacterium TaxID=2029982 RepID=A0A5S9QT66_9GAMM|nr:Uncharacterised protein [BD1-7 clade bacterium]